MSIPPVVTGVSAVPSSGTVSSGGIVTITLKTNEAVTVSSGGPILALNDGGTANFVSSASNASSLVFAYSVGSETTDDLKITGIEDGGRVTGPGGDALSSSLSENLNLAVNTDDWKVGKSGVFSAGSNWSLSAAPTSVQEAVISVGGTYTVSGIADTTVAALDIADKTATLLITSGSTFTATSGTDADANAGNITVQNGATFEAGGSFTNSGTLAVSGAADVSGTINNGGTIEAISAGDVALGGIVINAAAGVIDGDGTLHALTLTGSIGNAGLIEAKTSQGLVISGVVANAKTIEALGTSATVEIVSTTVTNTSGGLIEASGSGAQIALDGATITSGELKTTGANAAIAIVSGSSVTIGGATVAAASLVGVGGTLALSNVTLGAGALVDILSGGSAIVSGTVSNGGTMFADGGGSLLQVTSAAIVEGGLLKINDGDVELWSGGSNNVLFTSLGTGGLILGQTGSTYVGTKISGFGGVSGSNSTQFIDFTAVSSGSGVNVSYVPAASLTSGTLEVLSGGTIVAEATLVGKYTSANVFDVGSGISGSVEIIDSIPPVVTGVSAVPSSGTVSSGGIVTITLKTNEAVTVSSGGPILALNDGGTANFVSSASNASSLVFAYSVGSETTDDLKITGIEDGGRVTGPGGDALSSSLSENLNLAVNTDSDVWNVGKSGNFDVGSNWSLGASPAFGEDASIGAAGVYTVSDTTDATVGAIAVLDQSATLAIVDDAILSATSGTGSDANLGTIAVSNGGTFDIGGPFVNSGTLEAAATALGQAYVSASGGMSNAGTVVLSATEGAEASMFIDGGSVVNTGTINVLATDATASGSYDYHGDSGDSGGTGESGGSGGTGESGDSGGTGENVKRAHVTGATGAPHQTAATPGTGPTGDSYINAGKINIDADGKGDSANASISADVVTNSGSFQVSAGGAGYGLAYFNVVSSFTNAGTVEATATSNSTAAVTVVDSGSFTNSGTMEAVATAGGGHGSLEVDLNGSAGILCNSGTIEVSASGSGNATAELYTFGSGATIINAATIEAIASSHSEASVTVLGSGSLTNSGTIEALADGADSDGILQVAVPGSGGTLDNLGVIEVSAGGAGHATADVTANGSNTSVINSGTIEALAGAASSASLSFGGAFGATNAGTIAASANGADGFADIEIAFANGAVVNSGMIEALASAGGSAELQLNFELNSDSLDNTSGLVLASAGLGGTAFVELEYSTISGGTLETIGSGAMIEVDDSEGAVSGATIAPNTNIICLDGGTLQLVDVAFGGSDAVLAETGGTITISGAVSNSGTMGVLGTGELEIFGGTANISNSNNAIIEALASSAGYAYTSIGGGNLSNPGTMVASATGSSTAILDINVSSAGNAGTVEAIASSNSHASASISATSISNTGIMEASGAAGGIATLAINGTVDNSGGTILATGSATVDIDGADISGGTLQTTGSGAQILLYNTATVSDATIAAGSFMVASGGWLTLDGGTIAESALVEANGGTVYVSGSVGNSGTLFAGDGGLVDITSGAVVSGGVAAVGNGIVEIGGASSENVTFQSGGSGGLILADKAASATAYGGDVTGFGGKNGDNTAQYIDLTNVTSNDLVSESYSGSTSAGVLTVTSGGVVVAEIDLVGNYQSATFALSAYTGAVGTYGSVEITDPAGAMALGTAPTLASFAHSPQSLIGDDGARKVALFGSYIAAQFASVEGHVASQTPGIQQNEPMLAPSPLRNR